MRHALGFVLGLLLGAGVLAAAGWGYFRAVSGVALGDPQSSQALTGLGLAAGAGLVVGLLAAARWLSPLAALIAGVAYLGLTGFYVLAIDEFRDLLPNNDVGDGIGGLVASGVLGLVGVALIVAALHPHRWAAKEQQPAAGQPEQMYADLPPYDTGGYTAPTSGYQAPSSGYQSPPSGYSTPSSGYPSAGSGYPGSTTGYGSTGQEQGRHRPGEQNQ